jgi:hypothetical protein
MKKILILILILPITSTLLAQTLQLHINLTTHHGDYNGLHASIVNQEGEIKRVAAAKRNTFHLKLNNYYQITFTQAGSTAKKIEVNTYVSDAGQLRNFKFNLSLFMEKLIEESNDLNREGCKTKAIVFYDKQAKKFSLK